MYYSALTTTYERDIRIHTLVTSHGAGRVTHHEKKFKQKIVNNNFLLAIPYVHLGENTFIHCSLITLVHIYVNISVQNLPHMPYANGIKPGFITQKMTDKHAAEQLKDCMLGLKLICV